MEREKIDLSANNPFEQELMDNGYKWFDDHWKNSIRGFNKRITDHKGIKYFITGYHYNHGKQFVGHGLPDKDSYTFDCQFTIEDDEKPKTINLDFSANFNDDGPGPVTTLQEAEEFYAKFWTDFNCDYYDRYN